MPAKGYGALEQLGALSSHYHVAITTSKSEVGKERLQVLPAGRHAWENLIAAGNGRRDLRNIHDSRQGWGRHGKSPCVCCV